MPALLVRLTLLLISVLLFSQARVAGAEPTEIENSGWYAGLHMAAVFTGDVIDDSGQFTVGASSFGPATEYRYKTSLSTDPGFGAGAFVGYKIPFGFRFEIEMTYRRNALDELNAFSEFYNVNAQRMLDGYISSLAYMANVWYEFDLGAGWMPYLGFGLGGATKFMDCRGSCVVEQSFGSGFTPVESNRIESDVNGQTDFAVQVGAGIAYALNPKTVVSLDWRYFDSFEVDILTTGLVEDFDYSNQNLMLGIRRHF